MLPQICGQEMDGQGSFVEQGTIQKNALKAPHDASQDFRRKPVYETTVKLNYTQPPHPKDINNTTWVENQALKAATKFFTERVGEGYCFFFPD